MRFAQRFGTSLLALAIAAPAASATVTPAAAQSLVDVLFRNPAKRKRAMRDKQLRQEHGRQSVRREVRRKRAVARQVAKPAKPRRAASKPKRAPVRTAAVTPRRAAPAKIATIAAPTFLNYTAEPFVTLDMAPVAATVGRTIAAERVALEAAPIVRQVHDRRARAPRPLAAMSARAMMPPAAPDPAADPVRAINAMAGAGAPPALDGPPVLGPLAATTEAAMLDEDAAVRAVNEASDLDDGTLDRAPLFEVLRDPRADRLAEAEAAWDALGAMRERATEPVAAAVTAHYEATGALMWTDGARVRPAARQVIGVLEDAASYGLNPADYAVPPVPGRAASLDEHMAFELSLTVAAAQYVKDAAVGRVIADRLSGYHDLPRRDAELAGRLATLSDAASPADVLIDAHPDHREFALLRERLAELRGAANEPIPTLPEGTYIRAGQPNEQSATLVRILRRVASAEALDEHAAALALYDGGDVLPAEMDGLIRAVQAEKGLSADGIVGPRTVARLAGESPATQIERIELALERSRWLPPEYGDEYVMINAPAYRVQHIKDGAVDLSMRVVVGKPANQTNFFYDEIEHIEFNPDWGVPRSIIVNEMLPKLQSDPSYLDRIGYEVTNSKGKLVRSSNVNWWKYSDGKVPFNVRQPPGPKNALGQLKIEFPNKHLIYMHDTQAKGLFSNAQRAYSHGCVRLAEPLRMAAAMLGTDEADVERHLAKGHHNAPIDRRIPVYVSYFTAWPNDAGEIGFYADIYGRDGALKTALEKTAAARAG